MCVSLQLHKNFQEIIQIVQLFGPEHKLDIVDIACFCCSCFFYDSIRLNLIYLGSFIIFAFICFVLFLITLIEKQQVNCCSGH